MSTETPKTTEPVAKMDPKLRPVALLAWLWVLVPFGYGLNKLFDKIPDLF
jgi:hypothetical protein